MTTTTLEAPAAIREWAPHQLLARLVAPGEIALLDVREVGLFARKHLLAAVPAPLGRIELLIGALVPRRDTPVVLTDLDGSLLQAAAVRLRRLGYTDVAVLRGGTLAWESAGLEVFSGENVPSKAFGEFVEHEAHTPSITVEALRRKQAAGEPLVIVDGRTPEEFHSFSLPGAHSVPNGELPLRIRELAPDPRTLVVVNCAGRTRSIIGAQTLIEAGLPNPVVSLQDGTMAWLLAGHALDQGRASPLPEPSPAHLQAAREGAQAWSRRAGVRSIGRDELAALQAQRDRTLYRFDTRTAPEYASGHLPGWRWAPGGQLVQATDRFVGTRGARVVLADWDGVRAHATGAWLAQLGGLEVLLHQPSPDEDLETGPEPHRLRRDPALPDAPWVAPQAAHELLQTRVAVLFDVDSSLAYARQHVASALFAAPHRIAEVAAVQARGRIVLLTSSDGVLAQRVASALLAEGHDARAVRGGNLAWFAAGLPGASGADGNLTGEDDAFHGGYAYHDRSVRDAKFREYLDWEVGLLAQLPRQGARPGFRWVR